MSIINTIEFIYMETATITDASKTKGDLSKLHEAISIMFQELLVSLPTDMKDEIKNIVNLGPINYLANIDQLERTYYGSH
ncbi:4783_t:CDS:2, partial [Entrophospora sp. SA101]